MTPLLYMTIALFFLAGLLICILHGVEDAKEKRRLIAVVPLMAIAWPLSIVVLIGVAIASLHTGTKP